MKRMTQPFEHMFSCCTAFGLVLVANKQRVNAKWDQTERRCEHGSVSWAVWVHSNSNWSFVAVRRSDPSHRFIATVGKFRQFFGNLSTWFTSSSTENSCSRALALHAPSVAQRPVILVVHAGGARCLRTAMPSWIDVARRRREPKEYDWSCGTYCNSRSITHRWFAQ